MGGRVRKAGDFFSPEEEAAIVAAIVKAEALTSAEIRVHVASRCPGDALAAAREVFRQLGMAATEGRTGVLLYLAGLDRKFAVYADAAVDREVRSEFWDPLRDRLEERFREDAFAEGLVEAIGAIASRLAGPFPRAEGDVNELPDTLSGER